MTMCFAHVMSPFDIQINKKKWFQNTFQSVYSYCSKHIVALSKYDNTGKVIELPIIQLLSRFKTHMSSISH